MGKQIGPLPISGKVGNLCFYYVNGEGRVRMAGGASKERFMTDPGMEGTRKEATVFSRASHLGALIRKALEPYSGYAAESNMHNRLVSVLRKMIPNDKTALAGKQIIPKESMLKLNGFEWDKSQRLIRFAWMDYEASINENTGAMEIKIPSFVPVKCIGEVKNTTHIRLIMAGVSWSEKEDTVDVCHDQSRLLAINKEETGDFLLNDTVKLFADGRMFLGLGIEYSQEVGGTSEALLAGGAFRIVQVVH